MVILRSPPRGQGDFHHDGAVDDFAHEAVGPAAAHHGFGEFLYFSATSKSE